MFSASEGTLSRKCRILKLISFNVGFCLVFKSYQRNSTGLAQRVPDGIPWDQMWLLKSLFGTPWRVNFVPRTPVEFCNFSSFLNSEERIQFNSVFLPTRLSKCPIPPLLKYNTPMPAFLLWPTKCLESGEVAWLLISYLLLLHSLFNRYCLELNPTLFLWNWKHW